jgi:hypothetical protein
LNSKHQLDRLSGMSPLHCFFARRNQKEQTKSSEKKDKNSEVASFRIRSRSGVVRPDKFFDKFFCSFSQASSPPSSILQFYSRCSLSTLMLRFCSTHVSYFTVTHMGRVTYPLPIAVVCWLSHASRSACLGICCYLYICWVCCEVITCYISFWRYSCLTLMIITKIAKQWHLWALCEIIESLSR